MALSISSHCIQATSSTDVRKGGDHIILVHGDAEQRKKLVWHNLGSMSGRHNLGVGPILSVDRDDSAPLWGKLVHRKEGENDLRAARTLDALHSVHFVTIYTCLRLDSFDVSFIVMDRISSNATDYLQQVYKEDGAEVACRAWQVILAQMVCVRYLLWEMFDDTFIDSKADNIGVDIHKDGKYDGLFYESLGVHVPCLVRRQDGSQESVIVRLFDQYNTERHQRDGVPNHYYTYMHYEFYTDDEDAHDVELVIQQCPTRTPRLSEDIKLILEVDNSIRHGGRFSVINLWPSVVAVVPPILNPYGGGKALFMQHLQDPASAEYKFYLASKYAGTAIDQLKWEEENDLYNEYVKHYKLQPENIMTVQAMTAAQELSQLTGKYNNNSEFQDPDDGAVLTFIDTLEKKWQSIMHDFPRESWEYIREADLDMIRHRTKLVREYLKDHCQLVEETIRGYFGEPVTRKTWKIIHDVQVVHPREFTLQYLSENDLVVSDPRAPLHAQGGE